MIHSTPAHGHCGYTSELARQTETGSRPLEGHISLLSKINIS